MTRSYDAFSIFGGRMMRTNKNPQPQPAPSLVRLRDDFEHSLCRLKALAHALDSLYEDDVHEDVGLGFSLLFTDTVERFNQIHADLTAYDKQRGQVVEFAKVANFD